MKVRITKLHKDAEIPKYSKTGDAGMDLTTVRTTVDKQGNREYGTGLAIEIPQGHMGLLFPRSSVSKKPMILANSVGVIDSGYRGEIIFKFKPTALYQPLSDPVDFVTDSQEVQEIYKVGERIGQIIILPYPQIEFDEVDSLDSSQRGAGGFGSTGK